MGDLHLGGSIRNAAGILAALCLSLTAETSVAQEGPVPSRFEGAGTFVFVRGSENGPLGHATGTEAGFGGRLTVNIVRNVATEAEFTFYPGDAISDQRRKIQGLFGVKAGARRTRIGVFGTVRPGFFRVRDRDAVYIPEIGPGTRTRTWRTLDVGGAIEAYPSHRTVFRVDVGGTFTRYRILDPVTRRDIRIGTGLALRF